MLVCRHWIRVRGLAEMLIAISPCPWIWTRSSWIVKSNHHIVYKQPPVGRFEHYEASAPWDLPRTKQSEKLQMIKVPVLYATTIFLSSAETERRTCFGFLVHHRYRHNHIVGDGEVNLQIRTRRNLHSGPGQRSRPLLCTRCSLQPWIMVSDNLSLMMHWLTGNRWWGRASQVVEHKETHFNSDEKLLFNKISADEGSKSGQSLSG